MYSDVIVHISGSVFWNGINILFFKKGLSPTFFKDEQINFVAHLEVEVT